MLLCTRDIKGVSDLSGIPEGELLEFLKEWFDDKPYVIGHTSGSTGRPKEIHLSKVDMRASARITNAFLGIHEQSVLLLCLSLSYIAGKMMVVRALEAGARLIPGQVSSRPFRDMVADGPEGGVVIDLAAVVPMQLEESLKYPQEKAVFSGIRQVLVGGAPVSPALEEKLADLPVLCYATYGMTETVSHIALRKLNTDTPYFALGKVSFTVDERGCLVIHAPHLQGQTFVTNDLVEWVDCQHFRWQGRWDNVVNSGGVKLFPETIESKLANVITRRYFMTSLPDKLLGQRLVLVLEGEPLTATEMDHLNRKLSQLLSPYEMPKEILYLPRFQETTSGKVIRWLEPPGE